MPFFQSDNYRHLILESIKLKKSINKSFNRQYLAQKIGMQKSYLSKVLNGDANLNFDQLYLMASEFHWTEQQTEFANLLLSYSRSSHHGRKKQLLTKISEIKSKESNLSKHLKSEPLQVNVLKEYYMNPLLQLVYVGLSTDKLSQDLQELSASLAITDKELKESIDKLVQLQLIQIDGNNKFKTLKTNLHLPNTSEYFEAWYVLLKQFFLLKTIKKKKENNYNFATLFSADKPTYEWLQSSVAKLLKEAQQKVNAADEKDVFYFAIDLVKIGEDA